jgi:hypothetical protein
MSLFSLRTLKPINWLSWNFVWSSFHIYNFNSLTSIILAWQLHHLSLPVYSHGNCQDLHLMTHSVEDKACVWRWLALVFWHKQRCTVNLKIKPYAIVLYCQYHSTHYKCLQEFVALAHHIHVVTKIYINGNSIPSFSAANTWVLTLDPVLNQKLFLHSCSMSVSAS